MNRTITHRLGFSSALLLALTSRLFAYDLTVARDGTGNYTTVQAAIDAAPTGRTTPFTICIKNGRYKELVTVPATKPFIQLVGESGGNTIISYNNSADTIVGGVALGTQNSASVTINATDSSALPPSAGPPKPMLMCAAWPPGRTTCTSMWPACPSPAKWCLSKNGA